MSTIEYEPTAPGAESTDGAVLRIEGLHVTIETHAGTVRPVDGISLSVGVGETLGIVGESGSGKTMTAMSILRLLPPQGRITSGSISFGGTELTSLNDAQLRALRGKDIGMVFQDPMTSLNPTRTIGSQLREAYRIHHRGASLAEANSRAIEVLTLVRMPRPEDRLRDFPHQLSGGMRQRAMIAIALVCEPKLLIADEPTTALDVSIQAQILELIDELKSRLGMGVVLVTHDLGVIAGYADRVAVMYGGRIVEEAPTAALFSSPRHRYTQALLESMPTVDMDSSRALASIPGTPPQLIDVPPMCRFAARCRFADETCRTQEPQLSAAGDRHVHACFHPRTDGEDTPIEAGDAPPAATALPAAAGPLVTVERIEKRYRIKGPDLFGRARKLHAVSDISFEVYEGETLGIVGESGSGKTTVGRLLVGLEEPSSGTVAFAQNAGGSTQSARKRAGEVQMMFQDSGAALDPRMSVLELISEPLTVQRIGSRTDRRRRALELLDAVGLPRSAAEKRARVLRRSAATHRNGPCAHPAPQNHRRRRARVGA